MIIHNSQYSVSVSVISQLETANCDCKLSLYPKFSEEIGNNIAGAKNGKHNNDATERKS